MSRRWWTCTGLYCDVAERLGVQTVVESPPAYGPQANGSVENAVRQLKVDPRLDACVAGAGPGGDPGRPP
eukprot:11748255-Alexandrium_andersonii.AAC.1